MPAPIIGSLAQVGISAKKYGIMELSFTVSPGAGQSPFSGADFFDPAVLDVWGVVNAITLPDEQLPAFYYQDYAIGAVTSGYEHYTTVGSPLWRFRFPAKESGVFTITIHAFDRRAGGGESTSSINYTVSTGFDTKGVPRKDSRHSGLMAFDDGSPFYPIGTNMALNDGDKDGTVEWTVMMDHIADNGGNCARKWAIAGEGDSLEWMSTAPLDDGRTNSYGGLGVYNLRAGYRIDQYMNLAEARGIVVMMSILNHQMGQSPTANDDWLYNPYNSANGGPVTTTDSFRFFDNATAKAKFKNHLRYFVARYGAYSNLIIELGNEIGSWGNNGTMYTSGSVGTTNLAAIVQWAKDMSDYIVSGDASTFKGDPYNHIVTFSQDWEGSSTNPLTASHIEGIWTHPNIGLGNFHDYTDSEYGVRINGTQARPTPIQMVYGLRKRAGKPAIQGEYGMENWNPANSTNSYPEPGFNYSTGGGQALPQTDRDMLRDGIPASNIIWSQWHNLAGALYWWWGYWEQTGVPVGAALWSSGSRPANDAFGGWPLHSVVFPPLAQYIAGEDIAQFQPPVDTITTTQTAGIFVQAIGNDSRTYIFSRDKQDQFRSGVGPAVRANRSMTGQSVTRTGLKNGVYDIEHWNARSPGGLISSTSLTVTGGSLTIPLPSFKGAIATKVRLTGLQPNNKFTIIAADKAERTGANIGTPDYHGPVTTLGPTGITTTGSKIQFSYTTVSQTRAFMYDPNGHALSTHVEFMFQTDKIAVGADQVVFAIARGSNLASLNGYSFEARMKPTGNIDVQIARYAAGTSTLITNTGGAAAVTGYTVGTDYILEAEAIGAYPTTLRIRVYPSGATPPVWKITTTDNTALLQMTGNVGLRATNGASTNLPNTHLIDEFAAWDLNPRRINRRRMLVGA